MTDWLRIFLDVEKKKPILVNLQELIKSRALIQANSGGGKSHIMRKGIEEAYGKVHQIVIDPEGEFSTLREKYAFILVGKGPEADIQIDSKHAALLAKKIMESRADVIIDLYELIPSERIRFVKLFCEAVINLPKNLKHECLIWLDEIHVFAPESKSGRSESLSAVSSLASRGRKRGYALIGATQRISKLSKDVAAELNNKFIGRCSLDVDRKRAGEELGIKDTKVLRKLKHEFYAFGPAISDENVLVKAYDTQTTTEELGSIKRYSPSNKTKISGLMKNFSELPQEAELDLKTKEGLQLKVQELKTKLNQAERLQPKQDPNALKNAFTRGMAAGVLEGHKEIRAYKDYIMSAKKTVKDISNSFEKFFQIKPKFDLVLLTGPILPEQKPPEYTSPGITPKQEPPKIVVNSLDYSNQPKITGPNLETFVSTNPDLGRCERQCLIALKQKGGSATKLQVAVIAVYSFKSGGFNNSISRLKSGGFIVAQGNELTLTDLGHTEVQNEEIVSQTHEELLSFWINKLGKCPASILKFVCETHPTWCTKTSIAEATNYSSGSGGFNNGISKIVNLGLVERGHDGMIRATEEMFP